MSMESGLIALNAVILGGNGLLKSSVVIDVNILSCNTTDRSMHLPIRFGIPLINAVIAFNDGRIYGFGLNNKVFQAVQVVE